MFWYSLINFLCSSDEIQKFLGEGHFSKVYLARDNVSGEGVAIKVVRSVKRYIKNTKFEIDILREIKNLDRKQELYDSYHFTNYAHCLFSC